MKKKLDKCTWMRHKWEYNSNPQVLDNGLVVAKQKCQFCKQEREIEVDEPEEPSED